MISSQIADHRINAGESVIISEPLKLIEEYSTPQYSLNKSKFGFKFNDPNPPKVISPRRNKNKVKDINPDFLA